MLTLGTNPWYRNFSEVVQRAGGLAICTVGRHSDRTRYLVRVSVDRPVNADGEGMLWAIRQPDGMIIVCELHSHNKDEFELHCASGSTCATRTRLSPRSSPSPERKRPTLCDCAGPLSGVVSVGALRLSHGNARWRVAGAAMGRFQLAGRLLPRTTESRPRAAHDAQESSRAPRRSLPTVAGRPPSVAPTTATRTFAWSFPTVSGSNDASRCFRGGHRSSDGGSRSLDV